MKPIALALGGGGARGMAHLKYLELFDNKNIPLSRLAGTSIGAVIGALYASGKSSTEIQNELHQHIILKEDGPKDVLKKVPDMLTWLSKIRFDFTTTNLLRPDKFLEYLMSDLEVETFEDLNIPLTIIATDYWTGEEVAINSGPLMPAVMASMAIPGIFPPVEHLGRVLVDGSLSNCVPFDHLLDGESITIAIDVSPERSPEDRIIPKMIDASNGMFDMLIDKLAQHKVAHCQPDIYLRPGIKNIQVLDFDKIELVYEQAIKALPEFKKGCATKGILL